MAILDQLGINSSLFIQMGIFLFTGIILMNVLYRPYVTAFTAREKATIGGESSVQDLMGQTAHLQQTYDGKAKSINGEIKTIYDTFRAEAQKEQARLLAEAKAESDRLLEVARANVAKEIGLAHQGLKAEIPGLVQTIQNKILQK
jgi:F0F1-type ATP synthase membrane subunit b/b'